MERQKEQFNGGQDFELIVRRLLVAPARRRAVFTRSNRILASTLLEWHEFGYANTQIHRVANRAGVSTATLSLLFPDKDMLTCQALRLGHQIIIDLLTVDVRHPNPVTTLTQMVHTHRDTLRQDYVHKFMHNQVLMLQEPNIKDTVRQFTRDSRAQVRRFWQAKLQEFADQGLIRADSHDGGGCRLDDSFQARVLAQFLDNEAESAVDVMWQSDPQAMVEEFFSLNGTPEFHTLSLTNAWDLLRE